MKNWIKKVINNISTFIYESLSAFLSLIILIVKCVVIGYMVYFSFAVFLQTSVALISFFLVDLNSIKQTDSFTLTMQKYFHLSDEDIKGFAKGIAQTAIGAAIGASFTFFINFLIKIRSDVKNRTSSLRTMFEIVQINIQSLLLLKKDFLLPKYNETKNDDFDKKIYEILRMDDNAFLAFLESKPMTFKKRLNPDCNFDLDPKQFFYFLETETKDFRERMDSMLYYYLRAKENFGYLNEAMKHQKNLIEESERYEEKFFPIQMEKRGEYSGKFLFKLKRSHDDILLLVETILVFVLELKREIESFPKLPKRKDVLKKEFAALLPQEETYRIALDDRYYKRHKKRI